MPFPNKDTEDRAKEQTNLVFTLWPLDPQLLHCSMAQRDRRCPLGTAWWSGTLLSSKRCRLELSHAQGSSSPAYTTPLDKCYLKKAPSPWMWRDASIPIIFYKERVKEVQRTSQTSKRWDLWKCFKLYWPWANVKKLTVKEIQTPKKWIFKCTRKTSYAEMLADLSRQKYSIWMSLSTVTQSQNSWWSSSS